MPAGHLSEIGQSRRPATLCHAADLHHKGIVRACPQEPGRLKANQTNELACEFYFVGFLEHLCVANSWTAANHSDALKGGYWGRVNSRREKYSSRSCMNAFLAK